MTGFFPAATVLHPLDMAAVVNKDGTGCLFTGGDAFFKVGSADHAEQIAVRFLELANVMKAAQRDKEATA